MRRTAKPHRPRTARSRSTAFFRRSRAAQGGAPARLLVGLGNPGADAARHRHNVGFMALDAVASAQGFGAFRRRTRFHGEIADGRVGDETVLALKPQTYMNDSGRSLGAVLRYRKLGPESVSYTHLTLPTKRIV